MDARRRLLITILFATAGFGVSSVVLAQSDESTPEEQFHHRMRINQDITPLGDNSFGEQLDLYNGSLSFEQTDIVLHGNGPDIVIARSFAVGSRTEHQVSSIDGEFADWQLVVPELTSMVTGRQYGDTGPYAPYKGTWAVGPMPSDNRCSEMSTGVWIYREQSSVWSGMIPPSGSWSHGTRLIVPGQGSKEVLVRANSPLSPVMKSPAGGSMNFPAFTSDHWMVGCLPNTASGEPGEAFLVVAPDGTKYWLDWFRYEWGPLVYLPVPAPPGHPVQPFSAPSVYAKAMVTRIEDRFGNWVKYDYSGSQLTSITASDGRNVSVAWRGDAPYIDHITVNNGSGASRTWSYGYSDVSTIPNKPEYYRGRLSNTTLPDGSSWQFNLGQLLSATPGPEPDPTLPPAFCRGGYFGITNPNPFAGSITQPSGLVGTFTVSPNYRTRVGRLRPGVCDQQNAPQYFEPAEYWAEMLTSKTFSGAGVDETWNYAYSSPPIYWADECPNGVCPNHTVSTDVTDPSGTITRYSFDSTMNSYMEGKLVNTLYGFNSSTSSFVRQETRNYADPATGGPFNNPIGKTLDQLVNTEQQNTIAPLNQIQTTEDGDTYTWQVLAFNEYAQPVDVKRYNSIAGQSPLEEATTYLNDTSHWVLRLPQKIVNVSNGDEVEASNNYDLSNVTLQSRARFGQTLMSYTYNSGGQLASFTDGNNHTTNLGNYYRGIPQSIGYPDGTSQSLAIDDFGQISAITDQAGHTTRYGYDPIGRIARIDYPDNDAVAWFPKVFIYNYVGGAERGLGAGHWDRVTTTGNAQTVTYFDALLRPVLSDTSILGTANSDISTATAYDWKGQTTFASFPVAGSPDLSSITLGTHSTYDLLQRLIQNQQDSEQGLLTTTTSYLPGAAKQVVDPQGNATTTHYQVFDQPGYGTPVQIDTAGISQTISRDLYGNPHTITQSGLYGNETNSLTKSFYYDSFYRLCRSFGPESGSAVMAYDAANNLVWSAQGQAIADESCGQDQVVASAQTTRTYDAMNRLLTLTPPAGTQASAYTYDELGNIKSSVSGTASQSFTYNTRNLLTSQTLAVSGPGGRVWGLAYNYDPYGHVDAIGYPMNNGSSEGVSYAPDALGRSTRVGDYASGITYFPNGQVAGFTYGNGTSYLAQQNIRQLLSNFSYGAGDNLRVSEDFAYDANGNITNINDLAGGQRTKAFAYDALNRLTNAQADGLYGTESYTYDALNNLRTRLSAGNTLTFNYDAADRLANITNGASTITTYSYDPQGNRTGLGSGGATTAYTFDAKNQLTQVSGVESYAYDADGRRVMKAPTNGGAPTYYFYSQSGQLMFQFEPVTANATNYIYLGSQLIAEHSSKQIPTPGSISFSANPNDGNFTVSWGAVGEAISYTLQESPDDGSTWSTVYNGDSTSTTLTGQGGGGYLYRVDACTHDGCSAWVNGGPVIVTSTPTVAPTLDTPALSDNGSYTVSWHGLDDELSYNLQQQVNGSDWATIQNNTQLSWSASGQGNGTYTYRVQACMATGCGPWSSTGTTTVVYPPASAPSINAPSSSDTGGYTVNWSVVGEASSYTLQESVNDGGWVTVQADGNTSWSAAGRGDGHYGYRVQACNAGGCGPWSATGTVTVAIHPPEPSDAKLVSQSNSKMIWFYAEWSPVNGATYYEIQNASTGEQKYQGPETRVLAYAWAVGGVPTSYSVALRACNDSGCSAWVAVKQ